MTSPNNPQNTQEHEHQWSLAWNKEVNSNTIDADDGIFWRSVYLCHCGASQAVKHKWEQFNENL